MASLSSLHTKPSLFIQVLPQLSHSAWYTFASRINKLLLVFYIIIFCNKASLEYLGQ